MKQQLINWFNNNSGLVAVLIFLAGILGYFLKRLFFKDRSRKNLKQKQKSGNDSTNLQSGRDINIS